ncbi:hypothetical protein OKW31_002756 [Paraburkholderia atlantica]
MQIGGIFSAGCEISYLKGRSPTEKQQETF